MHVNSVQCRLQPPGPHHAYIHMYNTNINIGPQDSGQIKILGRADLCIVNITDSQISPFSPVLPPSRPLLSEHGGRRLKSINFFLLIFDFLVQVLTRGKNKKAIKSARKANFWEAGLCVRAVSNENGNILLSI